MKINYTAHKMLEEAITRINDMCDLGRIEIDTDPFGLENSMGDTEHPVSFGIAWPSIGAVEPDAAAEFAEQIAWIADIAGALNRMDISVDFDEQEDIDDEEYFDALHGLHNAIAAVDARAIRDYINR